MLVIEKVDRGKQKWLIDNIGFPLVVHFCLPVFKFINSHVGNSCKLNLKLCWGTGIAQLPHTRRLTLIVMCHTQHLLGIT